jgi:hypothetical protein
MHFGLAARVAESFGLGAIGGALVVVALLGAAVWVLARAAGARRLQHAGGASVRIETVAPIAVAAVLGSLALVLLRPQAAPGEGAYYARFFAPLQVALFLCAAFTVEALPRRVRTPAFVGALAAVAVVWLLGQGPLYAGSNTYMPDFERDLRDGCSVFGHAEVDRSQTVRGAVRTLEAIAKPACRNAAFAGYGWGAVSRYARDGDAQALQEALDSVTDPAARAAACAQARRLIQSMYAEAMSPERRSAGALYVDAACRAPASS